MIVCNRYNMVPSVVQDIETRTPRVSCLYITTTLGCHGNMAYTLYVGYHYFCVCAQVLATKLLVNWLVGDSSGGVKTASPVIRMLSTIIQTNGDLQMHKHVRYVCMCVYREATM